MLVYRICRDEFTNDLTGLGARLYGGRWNSKGISMLYTSSSRALATLEVLVHMPATITLVDYSIITIDVPENSIEEIPFSVIKSEYEIYGLNANFSQIGNAFCKKNNHLLLKVPSIIIREEFNYLINPSHKLFKEIRIKERKPFALDTRLVK